MAMDKFQKSAIPLQSRKSRKSDACENSVLHYHWYKFTLSLVLLCRQFWSLFILICKSYLLKYMQRPWDLI